LVGPQVRKIPEACAKAAGADNAVLGMIKRTFLCKSKELILQLYKSLIICQLDVLTGRVFNK